MLDDPAALYFVAAMTGVDFFVVGQGYPQNEPTCSEQIGWKIALQFFPGTGRIGKLTVCVSGVLPSPTAIGLMTTCAGGKPLSGGR